MLNKKLPPVCLSDGQFGWPLKCRKFNLRPGASVGNRVNNKASGNKKVN